jgi:hypothetical protein
MFCSHCGTQSGEAKRFCGACGAPLTPSRPSPPEHTASEPDEADLVARLGQALRAGGAAVVDQRVREAARGIGEDLRATVVTVATSAEGQQLAARVAELDAASGGTIRRGVEILGALLHARRPRT